MQHRTLGRTGIKVGPYALGTLMFATRMGNTPRLTDAPSCPAAAPPPGAPRTGPPAPHRQETAAMPPPGGAPAKSVAAVDPGPADRTRTVRHSGHLPRVLPAVNSQRAQGYSPSPSPSTLRTRALTQSASRWPGKTPRPTSPWPHDPTPAPRSRGYRTYVHSALQLDPARRPTRPAPRRQPAPRVGHPARHLTLRHCVGDRRRARPPTPSPTAGYRAVTSNCAWLTPRTPSSVSRFPTREPNSGRRGAGRRGAPHRWTRVDGACCWSTRSPTVGR